MWRVLIIILISYYPINGLSQLLINVVVMPEDATKVNDIYIAGNFQGWQPGNDNWKLKKLDNVNYQIELEVEARKLEFKFTLGDWSMVETGKQGESISNRVYHYKGGKDTLVVEIEAWNKANHHISTAAENVMIWNKSYYISELDRDRRIWIYLPPDYKQSKKRYPVLYMHDGQNVFDVSTSYAGEWEVDETLNTLFEEGDHGCIVVAVDNGEAERLNEYSPWENEKYGGGKGKAYVEFIVNSLKPKIDSFFLTKPGKEHTGIMGSSMGGLISLYAGLEYPDVFGKIGSFSPAYWFSEESFEHAGSKIPGQSTKIYTIAGEKEGSQYLQNVEQMEQILLSAGHIESNMKLFFHPDGEHSEWYWAREFRAAYLWLFSQ